MTASAAAAVARHRGARAGVRGEFEVRRQLSRLRGVFWLGLGVCICGRATSFGLDPRWGSRRDRLAVDPARRFLPFNFCSLPFRRTFSPAASNDACAGGWPDEACAWKVQGRLIPISVRHAPFGMRSSRFMFYLTRTRIGDLHHRDSQATPLILKIALFWDRIRARRSPSGLFTHGSRDRAQRQFQSLGFLGVASQPASSPLR